MLKKNNIRKNIFWIIDSLTGRDIKSHLKEVNLILDDPVSKRAKKIQPRCRKIKTKERRAQF